MIRQAGPPFEFCLFQPKGRLSAYVQGLWTASVSPEASGSIKKWLQGDACSGILFNLGAPIYLDEIQYFAKVILLPVSKEVHSITLPPGARVTGIRFHPGIGFGIFGTRYDKPTSATDGTLLFELHAISYCLVNILEHHARIVALYKWLSREINFSRVIPVSLLKALNVLRETQALGLPNGDIPLSQRQIERQFQKWIGMTPKQYQRLFRVNRTLSFLKRNPDADLVALAYNNGFSDQAHMTREFRQIAKITPRQYSKLMACRQTWLREPSGLKSSM